MNTFATAGIYAEQRMSCGEIIPTPGAAKGSDVIIGNAYNNKKRTKYAERQNRAFRNYSNQSGYWQCANECANSGAIPKFESIKLIGMVVHET